MMRILNDWKMRLVICVLCSFVSAFSNYSALKYQISMSRFDMIGSLYSDYYAFGITLMSDFFIIYFHLIKIQWLIIINTALSASLSVYAGTMLIFQTAGGSKFTTVIQSFTDINTFFQFFINILIALLPIFILNVLMISVSEDLDV